MERSVSWEESAFASSGGRLLEVLLVFGKCVGCRSGVVTNKICRFGSELSHPPSLPSYLSSASA